MVEALKEETPAAATPLPAPPEKEQPPVDTKPTEPEPAPSKAKEPEPAPAPQPAQPTAPDPAIVAQQEKIRADIAANEAEITELRQKVADGKFDLIDDGVKAIKTLLNRNAILESKLADTSAEVTTVRTVAQQTAAEREADRWWQNQWHSSPIGKDFPDVPADEAKELFQQQVAECAEFCRPEKLQDFASKRFREQLAARKEAAAAKSVAKEDKPERKERKEPVATMPKGSDRKIKPEEVAGKTALEILNEQPTSYWDS